MHILIINFGLNGLGEEDYLRYASSVAPAFNNLPGLISKSWLADSETNTYGGVYYWRDREALEGYKKTEIFQGMLGSPHFEDVTVKDFAVVEGPSRITNGLPEAGRVEDAPV